LAGTLQGDGIATAVIEQIRLGNDEPSWLEYLPEIHSQDDTNRMFLEKALALMASHLDDLSSEIDSLPALFDPASAPLEGLSESWLHWLAGWLAFPLDETWGEAKKRSAVANAFAIYGKRGTAESLAALVSLYTGAPAFVEQPAASSALWLLDDGLALGMDTMLAPAEAQGAVVGTTATLDQSHLIATEDFGAPLFAEMAHHFCIQVYATSTTTPAGLRAVEQIVEREKPAHTTYHLCQIGPEMRVGFQMRLGVDTIVAGNAAPLVLDNAGQLDVAGRLPDDGTAVLRLGSNTGIN
jgi:phage tail-like protein